MKKPYFKWTVAPKFTYVTSICSAHEQYQKYCINAWQAIWLAFIFWLYLVVFLDIVFFNRLFYFVTWQGVGANTANYGWKLNFAKSRRDFAQKNRPCPKTILTEKEDSSRAFGKVYFEICRLYNKFICKCIAPYCHKNVFFPIPFLPIPYWRFTLPDLAQPQLWHVKMRLGKTRQKTNKIIPLEQDSIGAIICWIQQEIKKSSDK